MALKQSASGGPAPRRPPSQIVSNVVSVSEMSKVCFLTRSFENDYQVTDEVLGEGMTGEVKVAVDRGTGAKVAVKTFEIDELSQGQLGDLKREMEIQSSIHHRNVAGLHRCYNSEGRVVLVMELLRGGSGFERLKRGYSETQAAAVVKQVLEAVEYLHANGIVHRDIKLDNIMFEDHVSDKVKLIDFGLACRWKEGSRLLTRSCGTRYYMAPEVVTSSYTNQADLWSIGIMAHQMLTDELPKLDVWTMQPILSVRLESCSPEAKSLVCGLLTKDSRRMTAAEALRHSWFQPKDLESQDKETREIEGGRPSGWRNVFHGMTNMRGALGRMRRRSRIAPLPEFTEVVPGHTAQLPS
jgi:calcium-dependent protein kinase